jgi:hypothetical protein
MSDSIAPPSGGEPAWVAQVAKEVRGPDLNGYATPTDFVKSYRDVAKERDTIKSEHEKLKAAPRGVMPLKADATPEQVAEFRKTFGVPDKPEGYMFKFPEGIPDGLVNPEDTKAFSALVHSLHVPLETAQKVIDFETQRAIKVHNDFAAKQNEIAKKTAAALVEKYKDGTDSKVKDALKAIEAFFGPEIRAKFEDKNDPMGNDLAWIEGAINLSQFVTERGLPGSGTGTGAVNAEPDFKGIYSKSYHDGHMN